MRYRLLVVAAGAKLGLSLAQNFLEGVDINPSDDANIFSDDVVGSSQELADQNLFAFNDVTIFPPSDAYSDSDIYSDPPLLLAASTCDDRANDNEDGYLSGKLRARDSPSMCYSQDPKAKDSEVEGWFQKLPNILRGGENPVPEPEPDPELAETQRFLENRVGYPDKCSPPYKFNLCCNGDLDGNLGPIYNALSVPAIYMRVEDCYHSMCMPLEKFHFILKREEGGLVVHSANLINLLCRRFSFFPLSYEV